MISFIRIAYVPFLFLVLIFPTFLYAYRLGYEEGRAEIIKTTKAVEDSKWQSITPLQHSQPNNSPANSENDGKQN